VGAARSTVNKVALRSCDKAVAGPAGMAADSPKEEANPDDRRVISRLLREQEQMHAAEPLESVLEAVENRSGSSQHNVPDL